MTRDLRATATYTAARLAKLERLAARPGTPGEGRAAREATAQIKARQPKSIIGRRIPRAKPCICGCREFCIEPPKGPHAFHLRCAGCGRGGRWMKRQEAAELAV